MEALILTGDNLSKQGIQERKDIILDNIGKGLMCPLDVFKTSKGLKQLCEELIKYTEQDAKIELSKYNKEQRTFGSVSFEFSNTGERLDYSKDHVVSDLERQLKERKDLVKLATKSKDKLYDGDGIEVTRVPVKTPSKEILKVSIK
ncbi:MAG: hypothetical protein AB8B61_09200 [Cyclobacteriaceae bacterium]